MTKKIIWVALILSIGLLFYIFYQGLGQPQNRHLQSVLINQKAPKFIKSDLITAETLDSESLFQKQYTLLNVFASWCVSCKDEHGLLMKLNRLDEVKVVGMNYKDSKADALDFLAKLGNPYHHIIADDGTLGFEYGVYAVPESFLIDKNGIIRYKVVGILTDSILENEIMPLVNQDGR